MKKLIPYKLFINESNKNSDFDEVFQTVKEILLEIEDMGIPILSQTNYDFLTHIFEQGQIMIFKIPSPFKSKEENYDNSIPIKIFFTNEIVEVIERVKDYCDSVGYYMDISINGSKFNFDLFKKIRFDLDPKRISINIEKRGGGQSVKTKR